MARERRVAEPRRHHYVPRFWLKRFGVERRPDRFQVRVFDKSTSAEFVTAIENIAVENGFNEIEDGEVRISLEDAISTIESDAAAIVARIVDERSIANLSEQDHAVLCTFAALQYLRGPDLRQRFLDSARQFRDLLQERHPNVDLPDHIANLPNENEQKLLVFRLITESIGEFAEHFVDKKALLFSSTQNAKFLLGDCPVALKNDNGYGLYGNIGLAVRGIQIYVPLSPDLCLAFWCPSILEDISNALEGGERALRQSGGYALLANPAEAARIREHRADLGARLRNIKAVSDGLQSGVAIPSIDDFVIHYNALQIAWAERFIIGNDFSLARRMILDNPQYRQGRRMRVG